MAESTPNIVLIHCHDLGQYFGCYGHDVETPNIDAIAESGVLFENHYATAPQCSPSRSSLMTGRYPHVNGMMGLAHEAWELHGDEITLPQYLKRAGYETHLFGLQHITDHLDRLGFEHIHSGGSLSPAVSPAVHEINRARDIAETLDVYFEKDTFETPFFLSVGVFEAHRLRGDDGLYGFTDTNYEPDDPSTIDPPAFLPDEPAVREDLAAMHGMVRALDEAVGTIRDALDTAGHSEDTLLAFTSDHGIAFPRAKGSCYDPGIEAALLLQYPDVIDSGQRCEELVSNVDLLPTLLDLVGESVPERIEGQSFLPALTDEKYYPRDQVFAEITWHDRYNPVRSIRTPGYKYIRCFWRLPTVYLTEDVFTSAVGRESCGLQSGQRPYEELYDLEADPEERDNLIDDPDYEHVATQLGGRLVRWMEQTEDPLLDGPVPPADYDEIVPDHVV